MQPTTFAHTDDGAHAKRIDQILADLATDDLIEICAMDAEQAKALIMKAREHWFAEEEGK